MTDPNQGYYAGQQGYPQGGYPHAGGYPQAGYPQGPPPGGYVPPTGGYAPPAGGYVPPTGFVPPQDGYGAAYPVDGDDTVKGFQFSDKTIRQAFIRKVYSILMIQLLVTFGFVALFSFHRPTQEWTMRNPYVVWIALGVMIVTMISMACCESVRRQSPTNIIFLGLFTIAEGLLLGVTAGTYKTEAVVMAVGITVVICLALTLFALQTKYDFTVCGGALLVILVVFVLFGFLLLFVSGPIMHKVYSCCGAVLFSFYLIYDTQMMLGGNHKYSISPEEYVFAALAIYLDVLMAVGITTVVCLALTIFALQTKFDFTVMGGVLLCVLVVFVLFGFIAMFFRGKTITIVYSAIGALLFSFYLIYDTQMMVGGNHKYSISPEEYIFAALTLYLDIVNIFIYILSIIGASKDN